MKSIEYMIYDIYKEIISRNLFVTIPPLFSRICWAIQQISTFQSRASLMWCWIISNLKLVILNQSFRVRDISSFCGFLNNISTEIVSVSMISWDEHYSALRKGLTNILSMYLSHSWLTGIHGIEVTWRLLSTKEHGEYIKM